MFFVFSRLRYSFRAREGTVRPLRMFMSSNGMRIVAPIRARMRGSRTVLVHTFVSPRDVPVHHKLRL
jgi:hypothetical protein